MNADVYSILNLVVELWLMGLAVAAFMVHRKLRIPGTANLERVTADEMPPQATKGVGSHREALVSAGFAHQFDAACLDASMITYLAMYSNPSTSESAVVMWVAGARGGTVTLEVGSDFDDGRSVHTSDAKVVGGLFDEAPGRYVYQFPGLELAGLRRHLTTARERHAAEASVVRVHDADLLQNLTRRLGHQSAYYEERGMLQKTEDGEYRPTLRGALLFAFRILPPQPILRRLSRRRRAASVARRA